MKINDITELAKNYQKQVYPTGAHPIQLKETEQAYLGGFYEALQVFRQLPNSQLQLAEDELKDWFKKRIEELQRESSQ